MGTSRLSLKIIFLGTFHNQIIWTTTKNIAEIFSYNTFLDFFQILKIKVYNREKDLKI